MLRTALLAATLFAASLNTFAHGNDYVRGQVLTVEPRLSLVFGSLRHDGFRVEYEFGGRRFLTHSAVHPGRVILVPPPYRVVEVVPHRHHRADDWRDDEHRGWRRGRGHRHGRHGDH